MTAPSFMIVSKLPLATSLNTSPQIIQYKLKGFLKAMRDMVRQRQRQGKLYLRTCDVQNRKVVTLQSNQAFLQDSNMQDSSTKASTTNGRWTKEEHLKFLEGLRIYGKNWKKIEQLVSTRTGTQIRSHAQKFFMKSKTPLRSEQECGSGAECSMGEEPQEATLNSKNSWESGEREESYLLSRIIEYSNDKQCFDFWSALVDSPEATVTPTQSVKHSSFIAFQKFHQPTPTTKI